jgi:protein SMG9
LEHHELGGHCTSGVDLLVTSNRVILIDTQPILSASVMDRLVQQENKKFAGTDFASTENAMEIQSLQLAAFLLSVCHVVILVQDWFFDPNLVRYDTTSKLLKPFVCVLFVLANETIVYLYMYTLFCFNVSAVCQSSRSEAQTLLYWAPAYSCLQCW